MLPALVTAHWGALGATAAWSSSLGRSRGFQSILEAAFSGHTASWAGITCSHCGSWHLGSASEVAWYLVWPPDTARKVPLKVPLLAANTTQSWWHQTVLGWHSSCSLSQSSSRRMSLCRLVAASVLHCVHTFVKGCMCDVTECKRTITGLCPGVNKWVYAALNHSNWLCLYEPGMKICAKAYAWLASDRSCHCHYGMAHARGSGMMAPCMRCHSYM